MMSLILFQILSIKVLSDNLQEPQDILDNELFIISSLPSSFLTKADSEVLLLCLRMIFLPKFYWLLNLAYIYCIL